MGTRFLVPPKLIIPIYHTNTRSYPNSVPVLTIPTLTIPVLTPLCTSIYLSYESTWFSLFCPNSVPVVTIPVLTIPPYYFYGCPPNELSSLFLPQTWQKIAQALYIRSKTAKKLGLKASLKASLNAGHSASHFFFIFLIFCDFFWNSTIFLIR